MAQLKYYYFTRGTLASELIGHGITVERTGNVYNPLRNSWKAEFSPLLCQVVRKYFKDRGLPVPQVIIEQEQQF